MQAPKSINAILKPLEILTQPMPPRPRPAAAEVGDDAGATGAAAADGVPAAGGREDGGGAARAAGGADAGQACLRHSG